MFRLKLPRMFRYQYRIGYVQFFDCNHTDSEYTQTYGLQPIVSLTKHCAIAKDRSSGQEDVFKVGQFRAGVSQVNLALINISIV
jgi:hypothetical protein